MGFLSDIGGALAGGSLVGTLTGISGAEGDLNRIAQDIQFSPGNVSSGLGGVRFDESGNATFNLDPRFQGVSNQLLGQSGGFLSAAGGFDPTQFATERFSAAQSIVAPQRQRAREALEARLLAQGRLGSTGGSQALGTQEREFADADSALALQAEQQAFGRQQQLQGLGLGALNAGLTLEQAPLALGQFGLSLGQGNLQAAQSRAGIQSEAAQLMPNFFAGLTSGIVSGGTRAMVGG